MLKLITELEFLEALYNVLRTGEPVEAEVIDHPTKVAAALGDE